MVSIAGEVRWANAAAVDRFGWTVDDLPIAGFDLIHPDDRATAAVSLVSVLGKDVGTLVAIRIRDKAGLYAWFEVRGKPMTDQREGVVLALREVTHRRQWELGQGSEHALGTLLDVAPIVAILSNADGRIRSANRHITRLTGRAIEGLLGSHLADLVVPADRPLIPAELALTPGSTGHRRCEARLARSDDAVVPVALTYVDLLDDRNIEGIFVSAVDITEVVGTRDRLAYLASDDELTGLANRTMLRARLQELTDGTTAVQSFAVVFGDIDGLKAINDCHGHRAGDTVIHAVAERIRAATRPGDLVARVGGDEFAVVVRTNNVNALASVERRIEKYVSAPLRLPNGHVVIPSISVGAAPIQPLIDVDELLSVADAAMYLRKAQRPVARSDP